MSELFQEYGGIIFLMLLGSGFLAGLSYILSVLLNGWTIY